MEELISGYLCFYIRSNLVIDMMLDPDGTLDALSSLGITSPLSGTQPESGEACRPGGPSSEPQTTGSTAQVEATEQGFSWSLHPGSDWIDALDQMWVETLVLDQSLTVLPSNGITVGLLKSHSFVILSDDTQ